MSESYYVLSRYSNAAAGFREVRLADSSSELRKTALFREGLCLFHSNDFKGASEILRQFAGRFPDDSDAAEAWFFGICHRILGDRDAAKSCFQTELGKISSQTEFVRIIQAEIDQLDKTR